VTIRRNVLITLASGGLLAMLATGPALAGSGVVQTMGTLTDLQTTITNSTDGARAQLVAYPDGRGGTSAVLVVSGINDSVGSTYGAHAHTGPCQVGAGAAAGPHFNTTATPPAKPTIVDDRHELWLDFTVRPGGVGIGRTTVPFVIAPGAAQSVVIHEKATNPVDGTAGGRQACLPVAF